MKNPRSSRPALFRSLLGSALLASPVFALTSAELDSLRTKADRGNAIAQYNLGLAYADRRESFYDPAQAYAWLSVASTNGTNGKALSNLTEILTPEQLAEGKRQLAALTNNPVSPVDTAASPITAVPETVTASPAPVITPADPDQDQKKLSAELSAAWKENELLKAGLTAQLADAKKRIAIAEAALASKDKEIASLQTRLDASPAVTVPAPVGISAELASLRAEQEQLQAAAASSEKAAADLRADLTKAKSEQASLQEKLTRATADLTNALRAQSLAESESSSLKAAADRASAERLAVAAQLETATTELAAAKAAPAYKLVIGNDELTNANEKLAALTKLTDEQNAQLATAKADGERLATELAAAKAASAKPTESPLPSPSLAALQAERDNLATAVKTLSHQRDDLTAQLAAAKAPAPTPEPTPTVTFAPVTTPAVNPEAAARLADLEKSKAETDDKLSAALRSFTLQQAEIDRLQKSLASIDAERAANATQLETATTELATLRPLAASATAVSTEAASLREQLVAAKQTIADQSTALATANANLADARKTVDNATTELVATRDQLRQTQAQSAASAVEAQQLKTRLALVGSLPSSTVPSRPGPIPSISINLPTTTVVPVAPPAPVTPPPAPVAAVAEPRVHTVAPGDTLSGISKKYYGTATRWNDILQANKAAIRNPDALALGTKLRIP
ncbi:MAG: LysM peptidoglycan-binding domain-containing protein [Opitutaceae bacterium]|jgi:chromosome segregation ATPase